MQEDNKAYVLSVGMFYIWVCAANLPIVINEMERDEQAAIISKLEQLLEVNQRNVPLDTIPFSAQSEDNIVNRNVFIVPRNRGVNGIKRVTNHSTLINKPYVQ